jgi:hypothetical protein
MANKYTDAVFKAHLPGMEKAVLYALAWRTNDNNGQCWPSIACISADCGFSRSTVNRTLPGLIKNGILKVIGKRPCKNGDTNIYQISYQRLTELGSESYQYRSATSSSEVTTSSSELPVPVAESVRTSSSELHGTHHRTHHLNSSENSSSQTKPSLAEPSLVPERDFETFDILTAEEEDFPDIGGMTENERTAWIRCCRRGAIAASEGSNERSSSRPEVGRLDPIEEDEIYGDKEDRQDEGIGESVWQPLKTV